MAVSEKTIEEFQQIIFEEYGKELSLQEASEMLTDIVGYFDLLAKIDFRIKTKLENSDVIL